MLEMDTKTQKPQKMTEQNEILNLDYHLKKLVVKALQKYWDERSTAAALGVSTRTLFRYKKLFGIKKDWLTKEVFIQNKLYQ